MVSSNEVHRIYTSDNAVDDLMLVGDVVWKFNHGRVVEGMPLY